MPKTKILICNYDDVFKIGLKEILERKEFSISNATNPEEILKQTKEIQPDIILVKKDRVKLTNREQEVVKLIVQEKANKEIAKTLFISQETVFKHVRKILTKLQVRSRVGIAKYAILEEIDKKTKLASFFYP